MFAQSNLGDMSGDPSSKVGDHVGSGGVHPRSCIESSEINGMGVGIVEKGAPCGEVQVRDSTKVTGKPIVKFEVSLVKGGVGKIRSRGGVGGRVYFRRLGTGVPDGGGGKPSIADDAVERDGNVSGGAGPGCPRPP